MQKSITELLQENKMLLVDANTKVTQAKIFLELQGGDNEEVLEYLNQAITSLNELNL